MIHTAFRVESWKARIYRDILQTFVVFK